MFALALLGGAGAPAWAEDPTVVKNESSLDALIQQLGLGAKSVATSASDVVEAAMSMLGVRYKFGGNTPDTGLDCSGLVRLAFAQTFGMTLPRSASEMSRVGDKVDRRELQPGDLVFFNTLRRAFSHVGIYVGDGKFVHAPSTGGEVRVESMNIPYWQSRFNGARRVAPDVVASSDEQPLAPMQKPVRLLAPEQSATNPGDRPAP
ncbi:MAG: C40 family peptidase [Burkholderiaceae bacterium]